MHDEILDDIHEWYRAEIETQTFSQIKSFLETLPTEESEEMPTIKEARDAICRFVYRNLLCESFPIEQKIIEFVIYKEDFWPYGYDY